MTNLRKQLLSRHQMLLLFAACAFPVYSWSMLRYFWMIPSWEKYLGFWNIATILAYALASAFAESVVICLILLLLYFVLPNAIVRERYVSKGGTLILVNTFWAIILHQLYWTKHIFLWTSARYLLGATLYLMSVSVTWVLMQRCAIFAEYIEALIDRTTVLLYLYVPLSALSILIVVAKNVL